MRQSILSKAYGLWGSVNVGLARAHEHFEPVKDWPKRSSSGGRRDLGVVVLVTVSLEGSIGGRLEISFLRLCMLYDLRHGCNHKWV